MSPVWRHSCIDSNAIFYQHLHHWHCTLLYCVSMSEVLKDFLLAAIYLEHVFNSLFSSLSSAYFTKAIFTVCWQVFVNVVVSVVVRRQYNVFWMLLLLLYTTVPTDKVVDDDCHARVMWLPHGLCTNRRYEGCVRTGKRCRQLIYFISCLFFFCTGRQF